MAQVSDLGRPALRPVRRSLAAPTQVPRVVVAALVAQPALEHEDAFGAAVTMRRVLGARLRPHEALADAAHRLLLQGMDADSRPRVFPGVGRKIERPARSLGQVEELLADRVAERRTGQGGGDSEQRVGGLVRCLPTLVAAIHVPLEGDTIPRLEGTQRISLCQRKEAVVRHVPHSMAYACRGPGGCLEQAIREARVAVEGT